jgi:hypothetical protein
VVHVYYRCESFGQGAATLNFGSPQKDARNIAKVNGIVARYQAYANALVVLMDDTVIFPYTEGFTATAPEGFERRKP